MLGFNCDVKTQIQILHKILQKNDIVYQVILRANKLGIDPYYIGAGCICQSVWNYQNHLNPMHGISDIDFVYFNNDDLSYEAENTMILKVKNEFSDLPISFDVKNQARVHLWYKEYYGYELSPYHSIEGAINTWPTTATSIGVRMQEGKFIVYAPFGMNDMFGQIIRANKTQITKETYMQKCNKWASKWNTLTFIQW
ncbi:MAG: nucleotidyltransferase family protein [Christensenellales bacterium]|jgi:hypothetical protein